MLYLALLFSVRKSLKSDRPSPLSNALGFLHRDFETRMAWWEFAEVFKKLFLVGIMTRIAAGTIVQLGVAIAFLLTFMLISSIAQPYRAAANDYVCAAPRSP